MNRPCKKEATKLMCALTRLNSGKNKTDTFKSLGVKESRDRESYARKIKWSSLEISERSAIRSGALNQRSTQSLKTQKATR